MINPFFKNHGPINIKNAKYQNHSLGLHLEGPYLNVAKKGIHSVEYIRPSSDQMIDFMCENAHLIAKVTLAPENNDPEHVKRLVDAGIIVSIGHTSLREVLC